MVPWSEAVDKQGHTGKRPDRDASQLTILALIPNSPSTDLYLASFCTTLGRRLLSSVFFFLFCIRSSGNRLHRSAALIKRINTLQWCAAIFNGAVACVKKILTLRRGMAKQASAHLSPR